MAIPSGRRSSAPSPVPSISGIAPSSADIVVVIRIGRRRRRPCRLRRWPEGPASADREVPSDAALRADAGLLAQSGPAAGLALERTGVGRAPRARVSSAATNRHLALGRPRHINSFATPGPATSVSWRTHHVGPPGRRRQSDAAGGQARDRRRHVVPKAQTIRRRRACLTAPFRAIASPRGTAHSRRITKFAARSINRAHHDRCWNVLSVISSACRRSSRKI
jgi:hypothetical protein